MKENKLKPVILALGTTLAMGLTGNVSAENSQNPFAVSDLEGGYMVAAGHEGKCGEGKCGEKDGEGKCGEGMGHKDEEGKCGEGKCGEGMSSKDKEGKCGEGKCGH